MTVAQSKRSDARLEQLRGEVRLQELRKARAQTQEAIAELMDIPQSSVSKIEQRTDAYVSTIRRYLEAIGGNLQIIARFPDGASFEITQFATSANRKVSKIENAEATLYRPVGPDELDLIAASGYRAFPPRLPEQPIFIPSAHWHMSSTLPNDGMFATVAPGISLNSTWTANTSHDTRFIKRGIGSISNIGFLQKTSMNSTSILSALSA